MGFGGCARTRAFSAYYTHLPRRLSTRTFFWTIADVISGGAATYKYQQCGRTSDLWSDYERCIRETRPQTWHFPTTSLRMGLREGVGEPRLRFTRARRHHHRMLTAIDSNSALYAAANALWGGMGQAYYCLAPTRTALGPVWRDAQREAAQAPLCRFIFLSTRREGCITLL